MTFPAKMRNSSTRGYVKITPSTGLQVRLQFFHKIKFNLFLKTGWRFTSCRKENRHQDGRHLFRHGIQSWNRRWWLLWASSNQQSLWDCPRVPLPDPRHISHCWCTRMACQVCVLCHCHVIPVLKKPPSSRGGDQNVETNCDEEPSQHLILSEDGTNDVKYTYRITWNVSCSVSETSLSFNIDLGIRYAMGL